MASLIYEFNRRQQRVIISEESHNNSNNSLIDGVTARETVKCDNWPIAPAGVMTFYRHDVNIV